MIQFIDATIGYPGAHPGGQMTPLREINLTIREKERLLLRGPNGTGKTTLLRTMLGLHPAMAGEVRNAFSCPGYMAQTAGAVRSIPMNVFDYIGLDFLDPRWFLFPSRRQRRKDRIQDVMEQTGLSGKGGRQIGELSGGEWQRARIARAIVHDVDFLVLDEPTSFLDEHGRQEIAHLIERLSVEQGFAVVMTSHYPSGEFGGFFDGELEIHDGQIHYRRT